MQSILNSYALHGVVEKTMSQSDEHKDQEEKVEDIDAGEEQLESDEAEETSEESIDDVKAQLEAAEQKAADNLEKVMRLQAELDNQRKRSEKQVSDAHKFASQKMVEAMLPVIDSLEMGIQAEGDLDSIRQGMELTMKQFESVLEKFNIEAVDPKGEEFNPELHQAMSMQPCEDQEDNTISMVMQKGYTLNGRLIRPAMVMVCKNS